MLDRQKVVNFVSAKLKEQGCKAYMPYSGCKYRYGKLKCAIGHIILDEEYDENLEGFDVGGIWKEIPKSLESFAEDKPFSEDSDLSSEDDFLVKLQSCHDEADNENFYESYLSLLKKHLDMQPETV
jgi:hypothetical protein